MPPVVREGFICLFGTVLASALMGWYFDEPLFYIVTSIHASLGVWFVIDYASGRRARRVERILAKWAADLPSKPED